MAKFATNISGVMFLLNLIQVTESISGFVVPLAMFDIQHSHHHTQVCGWKEVCFSPFFLLFNFGTWIKNSKRGQKMQPHIFIFLHLFVCYTKYQISDKRCMSSRVMRPRFSLSASCRDRVLSPSPSQKNIYKINCFVFLSFFRPIVSCSILQPDQRSNL